jgi:pseudaminic acid synthase
MKMNKSNLENSRNSGGVYIIAELSANHGHDLNVVLDSIRAIKRTGADAIKLQTFTADSMTLKSDLPQFMANPSGPWAGTSLYDLYTEAALPLEWHKTIFDFALEMGLDCFSSPFDFEAVDFLDQFDPPAYKIASFEITDIPLIEYAAVKKKPMIISTGVADDSDIELAIQACKNAGNEDITILKCTSAYPAKIEDANLVMIADIAKRFDVRVGLSDHTLGIESAMISTAIGAEVIEKHFILDKEIGGPDAHFSLDEKEFTKMVSMVRETEVLLGKVDYSLSSKTLQSRERARSLYVIKDVQKGDLVSAENIKSIRPGYGLHPKHYSEILKKSFNCDVQKGTPMNLDLLGD